MFIITRGKRLGNSSPKAKDKNGYGSSREVRIRQYKNTKGNFASMPFLINLIYSNTRFYDSYVISQWLKEWKRSILAKLHMRRSVWRLSYISQDINSILTLPSRIFTKNTKATGRDFLCYHPPELVLLTWSFYLMSFLIYSEQEMRWSPLLQDYSTHAWHTVSMQ